MIVKGLILFVSAQILGLLTAQRYLVALQSANLSISGLRFSFWDIFVSSVVLLVFIFFAFRRGRPSRIFFKIFLWLVIFSGSQVVFWAFLPPVTALIAFISFLVLISTIPRVAIQNLAVILAITGIGSMLGLSLTPMTAVILLALFSVYDIVAVYFTGHMVKMAENMIQSKAIFGLVIPNKFSDFKEKTGNMKLGEQFMILGSGDVALPLILVSSLVGVSLVQAWIVAGFAVVGFVITHFLFINQKERKPMAALPPIAMMSILGYLITSFLQ
ncbi:MAG TPA: presenilin family intramembrane aspartyl protease [Candidatus Paceibacterota bacterium]